MDKFSVYIPIFIFLLYKIQKKRSHYLFNNYIYSYNNLKNPRMFRKKEWNSQVDQEFLSEID